MRDPRRDKTEAIPAATMAELVASQKKVAKRDETLRGVTALNEEPPADSAPRVVHEIPRAPIPRDELEAALEDHLKLFPAGAREAFFRSFSARSYNAATSLIDDAAKLQPKNLTMARAASAVRHFAIARLEADLGGLNAIVRALRPLAFRDAPAAMHDLLRLIDGNSTVETLLRDSKVARLAGLQFLSDIARREYIELLARSSARAATVRVSPAAEGSPLLYELTPKGDLPVLSARKAKSSAPPPADLRSEAPPKVPSVPPLAGPVLELEAPRKPTPAVREEAKSEPPPVAAKIELDEAPARPTSAAPASAAPSPPPAAPVQPTIPVELATPAESVRAGVRRPAAEPSPPASEPPERVLESVSSRSTNPKPWLIALVAAVAVGALILLVTQNREPESSASASAPTTTIAPEVGSAPPAVVPTPEVPTTAAAPTTESSASARAPMATISVKVKVEPKFANVTLDGVLLSKKPIEVVIPKDGAEHELSVESPGFRQKKMTFTADADVSVLISLEKVGAAAPPSTSSSAAPKTPKTPPKPPPKPQPTGGARPAPTTI